MFGIFSYFKIAMVVLLLAALASAAWYYKWSQQEIATLRENVVKLEIAVAQSEAAVESLRNGVKQAVQAHQKVNAQFQRTRKENTRLKDLLSKHDLGFLAAKKPKLIENRVNKGTKNVGRCFEIASGSPLTQQERNATKPSEINSSCPELANPKFKVVR